MSTCIQALSEQPTPVFKPCDNTLPARVHSGPHGHKLVFRTCMHEHLHSGPEMTLAFNLGPESTPVSRHPGPARAGRPASRQANSIFRFNREEGGGDTGSIPCTKNATSRKLHIKSLLEHEAGRGGGGMSKHTSSVPCAKNATLRHFTSNSFLSMERERGGEDTHTGIMPCAKKCLDTSLHFTS